MLLLARTVRVSRTRAAVDTQFLLAFLLASTARVSCTLAAVDRVATVFDLSLLTFVSSSSWRCASDAT